MLRKIAVAIAVLFTGAVVALAIAIALFDPNDLKPFITTRVADFSGRKLEIGDLKIRKSLSPRIEASDIRFENAEWAHDPEFLRIERLSFQIRLLELLRARVVLPYLEIDGLAASLEKDVKGRANWDFTSQSPAEVAAKTVFPEGRTDFPMIRDLKLSDAHIVYRKGDVVVRDARIAEAKGRSDNRGVELDASGTYQKRPAKLRVNGDPVGRLWATKRPYPVAIRFETGAASDVPGDKFSADVKGELTDAFDQGRLAVDLTVRGTDMAQLYDIAGIVFPKTPPYSLEGKLRQAGAEWKFDDAKGRLGDSDLGGDIAIDTSADPPKMRAQLVSQKLDFDDLAGLVGAPPSTDKGETASPEQEAEARKAKAEKRLIPDTPIDLKRLHAMNVNARLDAKRVITKRIPIDDISLVIDLNDGVLRAKPAHFVIAGGAIDVSTVLDSNANPVRAELEGQVRRVPLFALFNSTQFKDESDGVIDGRARFSSSGGSVKEMAAKADGEAYVAMSGGKMSHLLLELIGLDVFESLGIVLTKDEPIDVRCALAKVVADDGKLKVDPLVIDTSDTKIAGKGAIDLASEKLDILITPYPKDFSPFTLRSPIRVAGKLADVDVFPDAAKLGPGSKIKEVLSTTLSAIIGLLPPFDEVLDDNSPCRDLLEDAKSSMAEVSGGEPAKPD